MRVPWSELTETVQKYWVQFGMGALAGALGAAWARMKRGLRRRRSVEAAIVSILHDRLLSGCLRALDSGACTAETWENLQLLFGSYTQLGGNGTIKTLMERVGQHVKIVDPLHSQGEGR